MLTALEMCVIQMNSKAKVRQCQESKINAKQICQIFQIWRILMLVHNTPWFKTPYTPIHIHTHKQYNTTNNSVPHDCSVCSILLVCVYICILYGIQRVTHLMRLLIVCTAVCSVYMWMFCRARMCACKRFVCTNVRHCFAVLYSPYKIYTYTHANNIERQRQILFFFKFKWNDTNGLL